MTTNWMGLGLELITQPRHVHTHRRLVDIWGDRIRCHEDLVGVVVPAIVMVGVVMEDVGMGEEEIATDVLDQDQDLHMAGIGIDIELLNGTFLTI